MEKGVGEKKKCPLRIRGREEAMMGREEKEGETQEDHAMLEPNWPHVYLQLPQTNQKVTNIDLH